MNRKIVIIISVSILAVLTFAGIYIYHRIKVKAVSSQESQIKEQRIKADWFKAVPIDAVAISCFTDLNDIEEMFLNESSPLNRYLDKNTVIFEFVHTLLVNNQDKNFAPVISLHYSAKNDLSLLFTISVDSSFNAAKLLNNNSIEFEKRSFSGADLYESGEISCAYFDGFFICSSSKILLESSVRHLASSTSILDNRDFRSTLNKCLHYKNVHIFNNMQSGKLFSGLFSREMLPYNDFLMNFSSWIAVEGRDVRSGAVEFRGYLYSMKGVGNFSSVFKGVVADEFEAAKILPYNTIAVLSISCENFDSYLSNEHLFLSYYKRLDSLEFSLQKKLFLKYKKSEVTAALIPLKTGNEWITLIRSRNKGNIKNENSRESLGMLFGTIFSNQSEDKSSNLNLWNIYGSEEAINRLINIKESDSTFRMFLKDNKMSSYVVNEGAIVTAILNNNFDSNIIPFLFNKRVSDSIYGKRVAGMMGESAILQIFPGEDSPEATLTFVSRK